MNAAHAFVFSEAGQLPCKRSIATKKLAFAILVLTALPMSAASDTIVGKATKARDADTIVVLGVPIRLNGVDAP